MKTKIIIAAAVVLLTVAGGALYWRGAGEPTFADAGDAALVARGHDVYVDYCGECHGKSGEGQKNWRRRRPDGRLPAPPHDETGHTWHHTDAQLFETTKRGTAALVSPGYKTDMIGFGETLSDTEIWAVLAYIKSRWPEAVRRRSAQINAQRR